MGIWWVIDQIYIWNRVSDEGPPWGIKSGRKSIRFQEQMSFVYLYRFFVADNPNNIFSDRRNGEIANLLEAKNRGWQN